MKDGVFLDGPLKLIFQVDVRNRIRICVRWRTIGVNNGRYVNLPRAIVTLKNPF
jgi:hypothetical protein